MPLAATAIGVAVWLTLGDVGNPRLLAAAETVFCGVFVQAVPLLVVGVVISSSIAAFVSQEWLARRLPRHGGLAVLSGAIAGAALPGCECGSVPVARRLFAEGTAGGAAVAFMLSAPAINPVVVTATAVAFPGQPWMVVGRCSAALLTAVIMGLAWWRWGKADWVAPRASDDGRHGELRLATFLAAARRDFLQSAAFLVVGAAAAGALRVLVPPRLFEHLAGNLALGVVMMAALAFVLALCSEADAFVAASLTMVPLVPRLVFLTVGPAVDLKLVAMHVGMFGRRFAAWFAPLTFVVAAAAGTAVGLVLL